MALNTAHSGAGVILFAGESIVMTQDNVELTFDKAPSDSHFKGTKNGRVFLTNQRLIFKTDGNNALQSFAMPFYYMKEVEIKQPTFGSNNIQGRILAQPGGGWEGDARFKLVFKSGGAINLGQTLIKIASKSPPVPPPHPKSQGAPPSAQQGTPYMQPFPAQGAYPAPGVYPAQAYPAQGAYPTPGAYPQPYPQQYPGYPPAPPQQAYPSPYYPPATAPTEQPPPYMPTAEQGNAYYNPANPGLVYVPPNPTTEPSAPPPAYSEKPKFE